MEGKAVIRKKSRDWGWLIRAERNLRAGLASAGVSADIRLCTDRPGGVLEVEVDPEHVDTVKFLLAEV